MVDKELKKNQEIKRTDPKKETPKDKEVLVKDKKIKEEKDRKDPKSENKNEIKPKKVVKENKELKKPEKESRRKTIEERYPEAIILRVPKKEAPKADLDKMRKELEEAVKPKPKVLRGLESLPPHLYYVDRVEPVLAHQLREAARYLHPGPKQKESQKRILVILDKYNGMTQRELTRHLNIRPASVSELLSKLEDANLIKKVPNERDRRVIDIELTKLGKKVAESYYNEFENPDESLFSVLTEDQQYQLNEILDTLLQYWGATRSPHEPPHPPVGPGPIPPHEREHLLHPREGELHLRRRENMPHRPEDFPPRPEDRAPHGPEGFPPRPEDRLPRGPEGYPPRPEDRPPRGPEGFPPRPEDRPPRGPKGFPPRPEDRPPRGPEGYPPRPEDRPPRGPEEWPPRPEDRLPRGPEEWPPRPEDRPPRGPEGFPPRPEDRPPRGPEGFPPRPEDRPPRGPEEWPPRPEDRPLRRPEDRRPGDFPPKSERKRPIPIEETLTPELIDELRYRYGKDFEVIKGVIEYIVNYLK